MNYLNLRLDRYHNEVLWPHFYAYRLKETLQSACFFAQRKPFIADCGQMQTN